MWVAEKLVTPDAEKFAVPAGGVERWESVDAD
jgi:hypothetical protein